jgi:hypothetical protein
VFGTVYDGVYIIRATKTVSSDGIMVDGTSPVSGTVYDGLGKCMYHYTIRLHSCL